MAEEIKGRYRLVITTPYGEVYGKSADLTEEEYEGMERLVIALSSTPFALETNDAVNKRVVYFSKKC